MNEADEFSAWYGRNHPRLRATLVAMSGNPDVGHDVADEAMVRAWMHWSRLRDVGSLEGWLYQTAINLLRRRQRRGRLLTVLTRQQNPPRAVDGRDASATLIWQVVADLPKRQREAVLLRHVGDLSQEEIAQVMGIARGTVSACLNAAYGNLRQQLQETRGAI